MKNVEGMTKHEVPERRSDASLFVIRHSSFVICAESLGALRPPHIRAGARIDLHSLAFLNEKRNVDRFA